MSRRFHIAFGVRDISASIAEYSERLQMNPCVVVADEYALWRSESLNVSIRTGDVGFRHIGWEDSDAKAATEAEDREGVVWERFSAEQQMEEILAIWPNAKVAESS